MKKIYWLTMIFITFASVEFFAFLALFFVNIPQPGKGLPVSGSSISHPYKSYTLQYGAKFWSTGTAFMLSPKTNKNLDFSIGEGTIVNDLGHQVTAENLNISTRKKDENEFRMLFLGGSTTFQTWPFLFAEAFNSQKLLGKKAIAINAGTGGYTSQENLVDLAITGISYKPDLVVAYLPINDIYWAAYFPGFRRDYTHMRIPLLKTKEINEPRQDLYPFPFTLKFIQKIIYKKKYDEFIKSIDSMNYVTKQPSPIINGTQKMDEENWRRTVDAVTENIDSMNALCASRGIRFVLLTQKIFKTNEKFYTFMDSFTLRAIESIKRHNVSKGIETIDMQNLIDENYRDADIALVKKYFPLRMHDFSEELSYDNMHFAPTANYLFAATAFESIFAKKFH